MQVGAAGRRPSLACYSRLPSPLRGSFWRTPLLAPRNGPRASMDPVWVSGKNLFFCASAKRMFSLPQFIDQKEWIAKTFPRDRRFENLIAVGENVLTADTIRYVGSLKS